MWMVIIYSYLLSFTGAFLHVSLKSALSLHLRLGLLTKALRQSQIKVTTQKQVGMSFYCHSWIHFIIFYY